MLKNEDIVAVARIAQSARLQNLILIGEVSLGSSIAYAPVDEPFTAKIQNIDALNSTFASFNCTIINGDVPGFYKVEVTH